MFEWMADAACRGKDTKLFFPDRYDSEVIRQARAICADCPVHIECLEYALSIPDLQGILAGTTTRQRLRLRSARRRTDRKENECRPPTSPPKSNPTSPTPTGSNSNNASTS